MNHKKKIYKFILNTLLISLLTSCTPQKNTSPYVVSGDGYMKKETMVYKK